MSRSHTMGSIVVRLLNSVGGIVGYVERRVVVGLARCEGHIEYYYSNLVSSLLHLSFFLPSSSLSPCPPPLYFFPFFLPPSQVVVQVCQEQGVKVLGELGVAVEAHTYPGMQHSSCEEEMEDFAAFLKGKVC